MRTAGVMALATLLLAAPSAGATAGHRYLVAASRGGPPRIEIVQGGRVTQVVATSTGVNEARWSVGGFALGWVALDTAFHVAHGDGSGGHVLVRPSTSCTADCGLLTFDWSPSDGETALVASVGADGHRVLRVDVASGRSVDVTPQGDASTRYSHPRWSPRGDLVAYTRYTGVEGTNTCCGIALVVAGTDGSNLRTLFTFDDALHDAPQVSWSPDGRRLAFTTEGNSPRDPRLAVLDVASGAVRPLSGLSPQTAPPFWSPDGLRLAFNRSNGRAVTVGIDGRGARPLAPGAIVDWSRDGTITLVRGPDVLETRDGGRSARVVFHAPPGTVVGPVDRL